MSPDSFVTYLPDRSRLRGGTQVLLLPGADDGEGLVEELLDHQTNLAHRSVVAKHLVLPESLATAVLACTQPQVPRQPLLILQVDLNEPLGIAIPPKGPLRPVVVVAADRHSVT